MQLELNVRCNIIKNERHKLNRLGRHGYVYSTFNRTKLVLRESKWGNPQVYTMCLVQLYAKYTQLYYSRMSNTCTHSQKWCLDNTWATMPSLVSLTLPAYNHMKLVCWGDTKLGNPHVYILYFMQSYALRNGYLQIGKRPEVWVSWLDALTQSGENPISGAVTSVRTWSGGIIHR